MIPVNRNMSELMNNVDRHAVTLTQEVHEDTQAAQEQSVPSYSTVTKGRLCEGQSPFSESYQHHTFCERLRVKLYVTETTASS